MRKKVTFETRLNKKTEQRFWPQMTRHWLQNNFKYLVLIAGVGLCASIIVHGISEVYPPIYLLFFYGVLTSLIPFFDLLWKSRQK